MSVNQYDAALYQAAYDFITPFFDYGLKNPSVDTSDTIVFHNVVRDFIQSFPYFNAEQDLLSQIEPILRHVCLDPSFGVIEFGSILPPPKESGSETESKINQLRRRMAYSSPFFLDFLNRFTHDDAPEKDLFLEKKFVFLIGNEASVSRFAALQRAADQANVTVVPAIFVSACPYYSQINKNRTPEEDSERSQKLADSLIQETGSYPILYISGYSGILGEDQRQREACLDNTCRFATKIAYRMLKLADTSGLSRKEDQAQLLKKLAERGVIGSKIGFHFHYNSKTSLTENLTRLSGLIYQAIQEGVRVFDGNSFHGGQKNPLLVTGGPVPLSGNLMFQHIVAILAALQLPCGRLKTKEDYVDAVYRCEYVQRQLYPKWVQPPPEDIFKAVISGF